MFFLTPCPQTPSICALPLQTDQVSRPYKTIRKTIVGVLDAPHNLWVWVSSKETKKKTTVDTFFKDSIYTCICNK